MWVNERVRGLRKKVREHNFFSPEYPEYFNEHRTAKLEALLEAKTSDLSEKDKRLIQNAVATAKEKFGTKERKFSTDLKVNHSLIVALEIIRIMQGKLPAESIAAAVLHDILEDTQTTKEELNQLFGPTVATMVQHLTHTENYNLTFYNQGIIAADEKFPGLIAIKVADQNHNLSDPARRLSLSETEVRNARQRVITKNKDSLLVLLQDDLEKTQIANRYDRVTYLSPCIQSLQQAIAYSEWTIALPLGKTIQKLAKKRRKA